MIKAILCDLDGTLLDSNALHAEAWQRTLDHFGFPITFSDALHQIGKGGDQLIPVFVPVEDRGRLEESIKKYRKDLFQTDYFDKVKPFPAASELIRSMKEAGLRIAIASSASREDLRRLQKIAGITDLVERETSSDDAEKSKPEPDIFKAALNQLGLPASESLALGDTPWDVQAAKKAGVDTVALTCGGWSENDLRESGAIEVYRDPAELLVQLRKSAFMRQLKQSA